MFPKEGVENIYRGLVKGVREFFSSLNREHAVIGLSGGLDSAVVLAIVAEALGSKNVDAILMPSPFSTFHSVSDGVELAANLGVRHHIVPIEGLYYKYVRELESLFKEPIKEITLENLQPRIRGDLLMAWSNNSGALLLNASNKSELAVGYGTLYGDLAGALMVIGDIYKLQVYQVANYINGLNGSIPESILTKEPSAELRDNQKDSDSLPPYQLLDPILYSLIEKKMSVEEIAKQYGNIEIVEEIARMVRGAKFKYLQLPPLLQVGPSPLLPSEKLIKVY